MKIIDLNRLKKYHEKIKELLTAYTTKEEFNNLEIGGRNLIINSSRYRENSPLTFTSSLQDGIRIIPTDVYMPCVPGETYTFQCKTDGKWGDHVTDGTGGGQTHLILYLQTANEVGTVKFADVGDLVSTEYKNKTGRGVWTYTIPTDKEYVRIIFRVDIHSDGSTPYTVNWWDLKAENGNKATPWTPAIEDTEAEIDNSIIELSMLGWSVPKECPIQNEVNGNQFVQKVGRVDLGSLEYANHEDYGVYTYAIRNKIKVHIVVETASNIYCRDYLTVSWDNLSNQGKVDTNYIASSGDGAIGFNTTLSAEQFQSKMQGQYLYYELATPITTTIDGNEIGETVSDVRKETTVNLLKPTLGTITQNGVTCTNNGDGTYTLNGTATDNTGFLICSFYFGDESYKLIGTPKGISNAYLFILENGSDVGDGLIVTGLSSEIIVGLYINSGTVLSNAIFKPMLTTNLNATYDDFVPYTGSTGQLNSDVAEVRKDFDEHTHDYLSLSGDNCYTTIYGGGSTGSDEGYRLIATVKIGAWTNMRSVFAVSGRHGGNGIFMIAYGCNNVTVSPSSTYCQINYCGNTSCGIVIDTRILQCYMSSDGTTLYFFYHYSDYDNTRFTCLDKCDGFIPNANGTWMTSIDESIYGTLIASTRINVAESDQNGNVINETYALLSHSHAISDVTGLQTALDGKPYYEEGKWTPIFDGKNYEYDAGGEYKRIGNIVFFVAYYKNTAFTSGVDITKVSGLPFSIKSSLGIAAYTGYDSYINGNATCNSTINNIRKYDSNTIEFGTMNASDTIKVTINAHISIRGYYYIA